jgi:hypothetical protein
MSVESGGDSWQQKIIQPHWPFRGSPIRPADISNGLTSIMLARRNILEDVYYRKIVPNRYIVEVNEQSYNSNFQSIHQQVIQQWSKKLMDQLMIANSRLGRKEYVFGGPVQVELRPAPDLTANQVRILFMVQNETAVAAQSQEESASCLELAPGRRRWLLRPGITTIGRYDICDIYLNDPDIQQNRMISGQHAYLRSERGGECRIFDGSPAGKPSVNGTYVNYERVPASGRVLQNGDFIILASVDPASPRSGVPGTASFYFYQDCKS